MWAGWLALLVAAAGARELDPGACAARFDVQRDKIIRTEESREMGARYLSELDVGARHECLRLCCETDACDVFVYEEKSPGSCYLFNCGPPEDFRCKFTAHSNFSSGVLALSRRLAELQDQERLAHHEQALASLRVAPASAGSMTPPPAPPTARPPRPPAPARLPPAPPTAAGGCSRYQFECRRGGECIAVYNACDGVPQCADGSDEAPELGCPPRAAPAPTTQAPESEARAEAAGARWPHRLAQAQPPRRYSEAGGGSHIFSHKGGLLQEPEAAPPFEPWPRRAWPPGAERTGGERWGGGMGSSGERWSGAGTGSERWGAVGAGGERWGGAGAGGERWGGAGAGGERWGGAAAWPEPDPRAWPVPQPRPELPERAGGTMPEVAAPLAGQPPSPRDQPKKGLELRAPPAPEPRAPPAQTRAPPAQPPPAPPAPPSERAPPAQPAHARAAHKELPASVSLGGGVAAHALLAAGEHDEHYEHDEHDGLSEHPPAAVLLLVLGVAMCASLGALAACRARAARRRLRRGKSPFAHDADYLVNGMYL